ncbi:MAG: DUF3995 domain-containing protein [Cyclobacteriaceae bacterium]
MTTTLCVLNCIILFFLSGLHFYWLLGGKWALASAIPTNPVGSALFKPGMAATLVVALGLFAFSSFYLIRAELLSIQIPSAILDYAGYGISTLFFLRAIGDFKYVGIFKKETTTPFASRDTKFYTPLCLLLALSGILIELV